MQEPSMYPRPDHRTDDMCCYILGDQTERRQCGALRRLGSPYCADHHALCHVPVGTVEEIERLREVEALATAVGGRKARDSSEPSKRFLKRLEHAVRSFS